MTITTILFDVGGVLIAPLPGPGPVILIPIGLGLLATEFIWARRSSRARCRSRR